MEILTNYLLSLLVVILTTVIGIFVKKYLGDKAADKIMDLVDPAINYGEKRAREELGDKVSSIEFDNKLIEKAVEFISANAPKWLKQSGFTGKFLKEYIRNKLG